MYRLSVRRITHARKHTHTHTDSEWQWHQLSHMQVCTSLQIDNHASTSLLSFLQAGCPSCHPTNSFQLHASCHLTAVSSGHAAGCQPAAALCRLKLWHFPLWTLRYHLDKQSKKIGDQPVYWDSPGKQKWKIVCGCTAYACACVKPC